MAKRLTNKTVAHPTLSPRERERCFTDYSDSLSARAQSHSLPRRERVGVRVLKLLEALRS